MERNKTGIVVLVLLAGFFIIAVAMVFNTSVRRESALKHQSSINEKIDFLNSIDLNVYWIGGFPAELEKLRESTNVIMPEAITKENMPIKASTFHITYTDGEGKEKEILPRKYSEYMMIVITTGEGFSDEAKEILRDCIVSNGVPVLCIGGDACEMVGTLLIHGSGYDKDHNFFYKLNDGYQDPYLDVKAVSAGGAEFADAFCTKLSEYCNMSATKKIAEASERIAAAQTAASIPNATSKASETAEASEMSPSESVTESSEKIVLPLPPSS